MTRTWTEPSPYLDSTVLSDQEAWVRRYPQCGGDRQSPIDLETDLILKDTTTELFFGPNYRRCCEELKVENSGRSGKEVNYFSLDDLKEISR